MTSPLIRETRLSMAEASGVVTGFAIINVFDALNLVQWLKDNFSKPRCLLQLDQMFANLSQRQSIGQLRKIIGRCPTVLLLKAFGKIGWAVEAGLESDFRHIPGLPVQQPAGFVETIFLQKGIGRFTGERDQLSIKLAFATAYRLFEIIDFDLGLFPG